MFRRFAFIASTVLSILGVLLFALGSPVEATDAVTVGLLWAILGYVCDD